MIYVLLLIVAGGGGLSAEFESLSACEAARDTFLADAEVQRYAAVCVPKG